jgi:hypothetical protein
MDFAMTATITLAAKGCTATFDVAEGGRLSSFRVGDHELLVAHGKDVFHSGSFLIARVGRPAARRAPELWRRPYHFTANCGPHALHGLATDRPWQVTGDGELSVELGDPVAVAVPGSPAHRNERRARDVPHRGACARGRRSGGILGLSAVWRERTHLLHLNSTLSPG